MSKAQSATTIESPNKDEFKNFYTLQNNSKNKRFFYVFFE
jgi:hypothetical protein